MPVRAIRPFERVVEEHGPAVLRFCAAQVGPDRAEDCFQETMLAALRAYGSLRDPALARSWLFSIASRKAIDTHRRSARTPRPTDEEAAPTVGGEVAPEDEDLWARVRTLPAKQRQAVTLRYRGDMSYAEIGAVMDTSEAAARRSVFEGLGRLRADASAGVILR